MNKLAKIESIKLKIFMILMKMLLSVKQNSYNWEIIINLTLYIMSSIIENLTKMIFVL